MAYLSEEDVHKAYTDACEEADQWRINYPQYERLADNGLLDDLDENLPEVNDGSLAASLFKLAKRVIRKKLNGQALAVDREEAWITKLANIYWNKKILPNAQSKASPRRKWKDAVRKAAIYGGQPIITLFLTRGNNTGSDFIVPYAHDVKLEAGKDSDADSDVIFWDVYYSKLQLENMIEAAEEEIKDGDSKPIKRQQPAQADTSTDKKDDTYSPIDDSTYDQTKGQPDPTNYWDIDELKAILETDPEEQRPGNQQANAEKTTGHKKSGYHFYVAYQRGVEAPFMMIHAARKKCVRQWSNPDPTGDIPVHYLYCYQDFINPYGIGIVKLAGGTQNVLDYMRQADILATQLGLRPPKQIQGDEDEVDEESLVYSQDANWYVGNAKVERMEMADGVYTQLPGRINMYQASLQKMIPMGDTSISGETSGDPTQSKTPAGVKLAAANLSIDDEDFAENVDECFAAVAKSMINTEFANMEGTDLLKLTDDERDELIKAGLVFPVDENGKPNTQELEITWEHVRAHFEFEIDPSTTYMTTDEEQVTILQEVLKEANMQTSYYLAQDGWKFNLGEAWYGLFSKLHLENFSSIITKMTDEEKQAAAQQPFPIIDPPQIRLTGQIPNGAMGPALAAGGVTVDPKAGNMQENIDLGDIMKDPTTTTLEKAQIKQMAGITPDPNAPTVDPNAQAPADPNAITPDLMLKADQQVHSQQMDKAKLGLEIAKTVQAGAQDAAGKDAKPPAKTAAPAANSETSKQLDQAHQHIKQVMKSYGVDAHTATAMLEAERQGYDPQEILAALKRRSNTAAPAVAGAK